jgi:hypothetical protein
LNIWLQLFIFSGYFIHVIDDVVFSSAKTHLPTDNLFVAKVAQNISESVLGVWATYFRIPGLVISLALAPGIDTQVQGISVLHHIQHCSKDYAIEVK